MNEKVIQQFLFEMEAQGLSKGRIKKLDYTLRALSKMLNKDFSKAKKDDIIKLIHALEESSYSDNTKVDCKKILKKFYKWLRKSDDVAPEEVRWIKAKIPRNRIKLPSDILTQEEVIRIIQASSTFRTKAMISVVYESAGRISEILNMKVKDVEFDDNGVLIRISGKTGERRVRLVNSEEHLRNWLNAHPNPEADSYVWTQSGKGRISYNRASDIVKRVSANAGIKKKVTPHLFRHSRLTHLAKVLTESELKVFAGWTMASDMAQVYIHLSAKDVDNSILAKVYKRKDIEVEENGIMKPKRCSRCGRENPFDSKFCNCGKILDEKVAVKYEKKMTGLEKLMDMNENDLEKLSDLIRSIQKIKERA